MRPPPPRSPLFPYTTLFRSKDAGSLDQVGETVTAQRSQCGIDAEAARPTGRLGDPVVVVARLQRDRKSTRLNSSHITISYAVFCLKKKKKTAAQHDMHEMKN